MFPLSYLNFFCWLQKHPSKKHDAKAKKVQLLILRCPSGSNLDSIQFISLPRPVEQTPEFEGGMDFTTRRRQNTIRKKSTRPHGKTSLDARVHH
jgi:hypothetical protein